ncbi:MAG TPA: hypothetical protein VIV63_05805 [Steroidobacteraceae bacterium]
MRSLCLALLLLVVNRADAQYKGLSGTAQVRVEITRSGSEWVAEYQFDREAPVWVFPRTDVTREDRQEWRPLSWTVETRGVRLERRGWYDVLVARDKVPRNVRIRFTPFPQGLQADYTPALEFTDDSVALYIAHFETFPMESIARVKALPSDLNNQLVPDANVTYVFRDRAGPVWLRGKRLAVAETTDKNTYVFFGSMKPIETRDMVGFIDPELPEWIRGSLVETVPDMLARYSRELGAPPGMKPTIMLSWAGPTPGLTSRAGSVLPGLIVLTYEGSGVLSEDDAARIEGLQFIAHEAAHFWLGQTVAYEYAKDAWITEGGADLLAMRLMESAHVGYDWRTDFNRAIEECVGFTRRRGIESARERNETRAYYACGAVFGLIAESASGRSFFTFVKRIVDSNRADGIVTRAEWLAALDSASRKPDLSRDIARLLDRGAPDPKVFIAALFTRAGVQHSIDAEGMPHLP